MEDYFVRNAADGGSDLADGLAWDTAKATIASAVTAAGTIGNRIIVASDFDNLEGESTSYTGGAVGTPTIVISSTKQADGILVTHAAGARFGVSASYDLSFISSWSIYGCSIYQDGGSTNEINFCVTNNNHTQRFYNCTFSFTRLVHASTYGRVEMYGCTLNGLAYTSSSVIVPVFGMEIYGGSIALANASSSYYLFNMTRGWVKLYGVDLSSLEDITKIAVSGNDAFVGFYGCDLPASWTTETLAGASGGVVLVERSSDADRELAAAGLVSFRTGMGNVAHDTATYRSGGESLPGYSWKAVGNATYCSYYQPLAVPPITAWCDGDNSASHTVTVEFASDTELTDATIWFDILYPAETATHQDGYASTRRAVGAAGEAYANGNSWTGLGATYWYSKTWTITPDFPGPVTVRAYVATAADDIYICPKLDVT